MTTIDGVQGRGNVAAILRREWTSVTRLLADLDPASWERPTRCAGWTIADLARHVVWGVSMEADALRRARTGAPGTAGGLALDTDSPASAILDALGAAVEELDRQMHALGPEDGARTCPMPYAELPLPAALDVFVFEAGIHASDFAHAEGRDRPLADDVVPATSTVMSQFLPVFAAASRATPPDGTSFSLRGDTVALEWRWVDSRLVVGDPGLAPTVTVDGDDSTVLLFAAGRLGVEDPRLVVSGDTDLARDLKTYVPGP